MRAPLPAASWTTFPTKTSREALKALSLVCLVSLREGIAPLIASMPVDAHPPSPWTNSTSSFYEQREAHDAQFREVMAREAAAAERAYDPHVPCDPPTQNGVSQCPERRPEHRYLHPLPAKRARSPPPAGLGHQPPIRKLEIGVAF